MVELPVVKKHLGPLLERHRSSVDILRERAESRGGVIYFDVSDLDLEGYNKLFPIIFTPMPLLGGRERFGDARESFGGHKPLEGSVGGGESRVAVRKIWRRRARAGRRDFAGPGDLAARARGG